MSYELYSSYQIFIILLGLAISIGCISFLIIKLKKKKYLSRKQLVLTLFLIIISITLNLINEQIIYKRVGDFFFIDPFILMNGVKIIQVLIPLITCSFIFFIFLSHRNNLNIDIEKKVDDFVKKALENENFATAFATRLPIGDSDKEFGLDYIPFILLSLEKRRKRFKVYSDRFLSATLLLGVSFVLIVIYFGHILLEDSSVGISKNVLELKTEIQQANANFRFIKSNDPFDALNTGETLDGIMKIELKKTDPNYKKIESLKKAVKTFSIDKNFDNFYEITKSIYDSINQIRDEKYIGLISKLQSQINDFSFSINLADANYKSSSNNMAKLVPKIENELEKPQNQLHELLKRLILSIVIISFFLAILRYTSKLYTNNYNLMIQTENDELAVRKFYIGLKNTDKNNEERKIVMQKFLDAYKPDNSEDQLNLSKEETGIIKDLLSNLMKKF